MALPADDDRLGVVSERARHPAAVVRELGGRATWQQLQRYATQHAVRRALDTGSIVRARRGVYVTAGLPHARSVAAGLGGIVSDLSAAMEHELAVLIPPDTVHVTVPPSSSRRGHEPGVTLHYRPVSRSEFAAGRTSLVDTVLDCASTLPFREGLAVSDSALRGGYVRPEALVEVAARRGGPGSRRALRVAVEADGDAANPFESALRAIVIETGVGGFRPQQRVLTAGGILRVDLGDAQRRIALEADSFAHHGSRRALRDDARRYDELVRVGWLVLRFTWEDVVLNPAWVAEAVRDACGWRDAA